MNKHMETFLELPADVALHGLSTENGKPIHLDFKGIKYKVSTDSDRYKVFSSAEPGKGLHCVNCDRIGTVMRLERHKSDAHINTLHFNLYTSDGILMTKDHIIPRSVHPEGKKASDTLDNYQTMCIKCNRNKGNNWLSKEDIENNRQ